MKKNEEEYNKFWFGFAVGSAFCGLCAMAVGTKQGRTFLKKSIDYMESVDGTSNQIHQITESIQQFTQALLEDTTPAKRAVDISAAVATVVKEVTDSSPQEAEAKKTINKKVEKDDSSLSSIIDKMRNFSSSKKSDTKFFKKTKK